MTSYHIGGKCPLLEDSSGHFCFCTKDAKAGNTFLYANPTKKLVSGDVFSVVPGVAMGNCL